MATKTKDLQLALNKLLKNIGSELFNKLTWDQKKFMAKTAGRLKLSRMKMKDKCDHKFWKDRQPPGCFNCGKTEQELLMENCRKELEANYEAALEVKKLRIKERMKKEIIRFANEYGKQIPKIKRYWQAGDNLDVFYGGMKKTLSDLIEKIKSL